MDILGLTFIVRKISVGVTFHLQKELQHPGSLRYVCFVANFGGQQKKPCEAFIGGMLKVLVIISRVEVWR